MYADRYGAGIQVKPVSTGLALAMTALPIVALVLGLQVSHAIVRTPDTHIFDVDQPKPPKPDPVTKTPPKAPTVEQVVVPPIQTPLDPPISIDTTPIAPVGPIAPIQPGGGTGILPGVPEPVIVPHPPVMVGAEIDGRYRGLLQPPYPPEEIRMGRSGRVSVRVLIGADGRVKQVTRVSATSDAFYAAAEKQALGKWRFKPATKDGIAVEQWKVMNLNFVLNEE